MPKILLLGMLGVLFPGLMTGCKNRAINPSKVQAHSPLISGIDSPFMTRVKGLNGVDPAERQIRYFKKISSHHNKIRAGLHYNNDLRYYSEGQGYYFGGHPMVVNQAHLKSGFLSDYANLLPQYLMYKILDKFYKLETKEVSGLRPGDNAFLFASPQFKRLKKHFKYHVDGSATLGRDLFIVFGGKEIAHKSQGEECELSWTGILERIKVVGDLTHLNYSILQSIPGHEFQVEGRSCRSGTRLILPTSKLINLNKLFIEQAYLRNKKHQELVRNYFPGQRFDLINFNKPVIFCSGPSSGRYYRMARVIQQSFPLNQVEVVVTQGSEENLSKLTDGLCNMAISQEDIFHEFRAGHGFSHVAAHAAPLFSENMFLLCHRDVMADASSELSANQTVIVGGMKSGSARSFAALGEVQANLKKVRRLYKVGHSAISELLTYPSHQICFFSVSHPSAAIIRYANSFPEFKLLTIDADYSGYQPELLKAEQYKSLAIMPSTRTLSTKAIFLYDKKWAGDIRFQQLFASFLPLLTFISQGKTMLGSAQQEGKLGDLRICSGNIGGEYDRFVETLRIKLQQSNIINRTTAGSLENLKLLAEKKCDVAIAQEDVVAAFREQSPAVALAIDKAPLFDEFAFLVCKKNTNIERIQDLNDWWHAVYSGEAESGGTFTWRRLKKVLPNLKLLKENHLKVEASLYQILSGEGHCFFMVSGLSEVASERNILAFANNHPELTLVDTFVPPANYPAAIIRSELLPLLTQSRDVKTFKIRAQLVYSPSIGQHVIKYAALEKIRQLLYHRQQLTGESGHE